MGEAKKHISIALGLFSWVGILELERVTSKSLWKKASLACGGRNRQAVPALTSTSTCPPFPPHHWRLLCRFFPLLYKKL